MVIPESIEGEARPATPAATLVRTKSLRFMGDSFSPQAGGLGGGKRLRMLRKA
jgi:hypothetical protein